MIMIMIMSVIVMMIIIMMIMIMTINTFKLTLIYKYCPKFEENMQQMYFDVAGLTQAP
jgi:hypothetical protein